TPAAIRKLLRRCLERDRNLRLHDIADARLEIDEARSGSSESLPPQAPRKTTRWQWIAIAALALAVIVLSLVHFRETPPRRPVTTFSIPVPENTTGMDNASLSPDGRHIAFTAIPKGSNAPSLYVRSLDSLAQRALKGTEGARSAFWSPDGRYLAFQTGGKLK